MPMRLSKGMWSFLCNRRIISSDRRINGDILVFQSRGGIVLSQKFRMSRLFSPIVFSVARPLSAATGCPNSVVKRGVLLNAG